MVDPTLYSTRHGGLPLHEIISTLEEEDIESADIYMIPPDDGDETDKDSDKSDDEHVANINNLGPALLNTNCEAVIYHKEPPDFDSDDDIPLKTIQQNCNKPSTSKTNTKIPYKQQCQWKTNSPSFTINTTCISENPPQELYSLDSPLQFLKLYMDDEIVNNLVEQSNLYASQKNENLNLTINELYVVIGGLLLTGYAKYPNKRMFWSYENDVPKILSESIRLNRFEQILRHLHINDNTHINKDDRLYKLRPLITKLNENFRKYGELEENISIDESMIPYYGKHYAKQFIKCKPIRFGFKNWAMCTSNGYMLAFDIYTGKQDSTNNNEFGVGGSVVLSLLELGKIPPNEGYKIYFDNYFTSLKLLRHLSDKGYCATGTLRENRVEKCPLKSKKEWNKLQRGSVDYKTSNQVFVVQWKDNKVVTAASNFDNVEMKTVSRFSRELKSKVTVPQPTVIHHYNHGMGGVDKIDNMIANYRTRMRQRKWWWPIFVYLLDTCVVNAWLQMRKVHPENQVCQNLLPFRRNIAITLLRSFGVKTNKGKTVALPNADIRYDRIDHLPDYSETDRRCAQCGKKSKFICSKCNIGLHPKDCFKQYHTK